MGDDVYRVRITKEREHMSYLPYKLLTVSQEESPLMASGGEIGTGSTSKQEGLGDSNQAKEDASSEEEQLYEKMARLVLSNGHYHLWNYPALLSNSANNEQGPPGSDSMDIASQPQLDSRSVQASSISEDAADSEDAMDIVNGKRKSPLPGHLGDREGQVEETLPVKRWKEESTSSSSSALSTPLTAISDSLVPNLAETNRLLGSIPALQPVTVGYFEDFPVNKKAVQQRDFLSTLSVNDPAYADLVHGSIRVVSPKRKFVRIVAADCEMCDTTLGMEIVRVTLLAPMLEEETEDQPCINNEYGGKKEVYRGCRVLLDSLVLPRGQVLDYRTEFSGVSAATLQSVTTTFAQIQLALLRIITQETLLIGHSLDSDLRALHLYHRNCIDTAILFPHACGYPLRRKLRHLAKDCLNMTIQSTTSGKNEGHDSREDAHAALQLVLLRVERGDQFGPKQSSTRASILKSYTTMQVRASLVTCLLDQEGKTLEEDKAAILLEGDPQESSKSTSSTANNTNNGNNNVKNGLKYSGKGFYYALEDAVDGNAETLRCHPNNLPETVAQVVLRASSSKDLTPLSSVRSLPELSANAKELDPPILVCASIPTSPDYTEQDVRSMIESLQKQLQEHAGEKHGLLLVTTQGDVHRVQDLFQRKRGSQHPLSAVTWNGQLEKTLKEEIANVNLGFISMSVV